MTDSPEEEAQLEADAKAYALDKAKAKKIPLVELFGPTIQGEGSVIGQQTYFLRFGLCDYRCTMCDSLHAVLPESVKRLATWMTQDELYQAFYEFRDKLPNSTEWVTFSGGNPAMHDLGYLLGMLKLGGFKVNVETQGTIWQGWLGKVDSLTISPKGPGMGEVTHIEVLDGFMGKLQQSSVALGDIPLKTNASFKIVAFDQRDLDFAAEIFDRYKAIIPLSDCYLSLGNPMPPQAWGTTEPTAEEVWGWKADLIDQYKILFEDIQNHPILAHVKFLPQWHALVWGNGQGH